MDGFTAYKLYFALKLHFSSLKYDVFETRGAVKGLTLDVFRKKKEAKWFNFLATKFKEPKEFVQFVVSCAAYGDITDVFDLQVAFEHYAKWTKHKQMTTRLILDDLDQIEDLEELTVGCPPPILQRVIANRINIETAIAVNAVKPFLSQELFEKDYLIFSREAIKLKKLGRFVKYNKDEINLAIQSKISLNTDVR